MARTGAQKHIHKYLLDENTGVWSCALPDCTHFMPKNVAHMVVGKRSLCWGCDRPFQLTPYNMTEIKPQCDLCSEEIDVLSNFLARKGVAETPKTQMEIAIEKVHEKLEQKVEENEDKPESEYVEPQE